MKNSRIFLLLNLVLFLIVTPSCEESAVKTATPWPSCINYSELALQRTERIMKNKPENITIVMLGNSITQGAGDWNEKLERNDVLNSGQGGYTTQQFSWLLDPVVFKVKPEYCFIMGGINDISLGVPDERIIKNYRYLIEKIKSKGIKPVVQSTLYQSANSKSNSHVENLNNFLEDYCKKNNIPYIDLNSRMSDEQGLKTDLTTDGTHLTEKGYMIWSEILRDYMNKHI